MEPSPGLENPDYFVYVIRNPAGILYTGIAKNIDARLSSHNAGTGARFTRGRGPWKVVHREGPLHYGPALSRELTLKADRKFKATLKPKVGKPKAAKSKAKKKTKAP